MQARWLMSCSQKAPAVCQWVDLHWQANVSPCGFPDWENLAVTVAVQKDCQETTQMSFKKQRRKGKSVAEDPKRSTNLHLVFTDLLRDTGLRSDSSADVRGAQWKMAIIKNRRQRMGSVALLKQQSRRECICLQFGVMIYRKKRVQIVWQNSCENANTGSLLMLNLTTNLQCCLFWMVIALQGLWQGTFPGLPRDPISHFNLDLTSYLYLLGMAT